MLHAGLADLAREGSGLLGLVWPSKGALSVFAERAVVRAFFRRYDMTNNDTILPAVCLLSMNV